MDTNGNNQDRDECQVVTVVGGYRVILGEKIHVVNKHRQCSCARLGCPAIKRVAAYLKAGGQRAPSATSTSSSTIDNLCPICCSAITGTLASKDWFCSVDRLHYWQWRADRLKAAHDRLLAKASPYTLEVLSSFASNEAREGFLAQHRLTYAAEA